MWTKRRWWLYKVWVPSKIIIFHWLKSTQCFFWGRKNAMELKFWWGILRMRTTCRRPCKSENSRTKEDSASRKFGTCEPKKMVTLSSLGPMEKYRKLYRWGSNRHSFDSNQKGGYRGDCFGEASLYPDNMYASVEVVKHRHERRWCL